MEAIERNRTEVVEKLVKKYRTISPLLGKIEEVGGQFGLLPRQINKVDVGATSKTGGSHTGVFETLQR